MYEFIHFKAVNKYCQFFVIKYFFCVFVFPLVNIYLYGFGSSLSIRFSCPRFARSSVQRRTFPLRLESDMSMTSCSVAWQSRLTEGRFRNVYAVVGCYCMEHVSGCDKAWSSRIGVPAANSVLASPQSSSQSK